MNSRKRAFLLVAILALTVILAGCGARYVDLDTSMFANGGATTYDDTQGGGYEGGQGIAQVENASQYQRVVCYDSDLGCEAVRSLAPMDWQAGGQAYWVIQSSTAPAIADLYIVEPNNRARAGFVSPLGYAVPDQIEQLSEGQWCAVLQAPTKAYQNAETYAQSYFQEYAGIPNTQVIDVKYPEGEAATAISDYTAWLQQTIDQAMSQTVGQGNASYKFSVDAAEVYLGFEYEGKLCKAKAFVMVTALEITYTYDDSYYSMLNNYSIGWSTNPLGFRYYMAEESCFDEYEAVADMFSANLIVNDQWIDVLNQVALKMNQDYQQGVLEQVEAWKEANASYPSQVFQGSSSSPSYSGSSSGYDTDVMGGWTNAITGQSYYEGPDGGHMLLDSNQYHYTDGSSVYSSSDPLNTGGTNLSPLTDLGTMGGD